jgi:Cdc6-like AAA superfamily ATPase
VRPYSAHKLAVVDGKLAVIMDFQEKMLYLLKIGQAFRPGAPIDNKALFAGRYKQIRSIIDAINQVGQHAVIFGERGVGKTSLSKVIVEFITGSGVDVISPENVNCDGTDVFTSIWMKVFRELTELLNTQNRETDREVSLGGDYDSPDDVRFALSRLTKPAVIILDEIDQITDDEATELLAATIKTLSDHASPVTLILIGVADSVDDLIEGHLSVERAIVQVHLQRMSILELREIITKGEKEAGIHFDNASTEQIVMLSAGLPHYTHTLAKFAAENAITERESTTINMIDVSEAVRRTVEAPGSLLSAYEQATQSSRDTYFRQVLLACALTSKSELGLFSAGDVRGPLEMVMGKKYDIPSFSRHLKALCSDSRGAVLEKMESRKYRFKNPLLQPFVIIHGLSHGLLSPEKLIANEPPAMEST